MVKKLLALGSDPTQLGMNESNVLHICAERSFTEIAKMIIETDREKYGNMVFQQTTIEDEEGGMTPLHVACEWNSMDLVEYFFEIGGEKLVKIKNGEGMDSIEFAYAENMEEPYIYLSTKLGLKSSWIFCTVF